MHVSTTQLIIDIAGTICFVLCCLWPFWAMNKFIDDNNDDNKGGRV